ncbi:MAG TPA: Fe-S cluster assembly protein SufD [Candidatus Acidoferrales bacterium]|nr:Fe-S cluster assembly protein SufD [Candidatus Acidoferrales bacterium]
MIASAEQLQPYLESFAAFAKSAPGRDLAWLRSLREEAFARFCEMGFPTTRAEDWRFTSVSAIAQTRFRLPRRGAASVSAETLAACQVPGAACRLVFIDGSFISHLSDSGKLPESVRVANLAAEIESHPRELEPHLGRYLNIQRDAFASLNTAFLEDGAYIRIRPGAALAAPIHLLFLSTGGSEPLASHPRNLIVAEAGSEITVIEEYASLAPGVALCNTATEIVAGDNAVVTHYMIEREDVQSFNVSTLRIQQGQDANVASHSILAGGAIVRNNVHPVLAGQGGECLINGLFIGSGRQHLDNYMLVEHASPHCGSRQFYNGILDQHAHGVFHGRIIVHKDAQKTDAKQTNRNLLLSDDAQVDTKPQLEIYADDVKCTHGATIGQIEENALFYLRSRGIDEASARRLLLLAFASECVERMKEGPARTYAEQFIHGRLFATTRAARESAASAAVAAAASANGEERG